MNISRRHSSQCVPGSLDDFFIGEFVVYAVTANENEIMVSGDFEGFDIRDCYYDVRVPTEFGQFGFCVAESARNLDGEY
jgi:hypothetical protein